MQLRIAALASVALLAGCESMSPYEKAWQAMHLVDVAQTLNGPASDPCYSEQDPITSSLIGEHPSRGEVLAWGVGLSVTHYYLGEWVDNSDWPEGVKTLVRSIDIGYKGLTIGNNHETGIRAFGSNASCEPPPFTIPDAQPWK